MSIQPTTLVAGYCDELDLARLHQAPDELTRIGKRRRLQQSQVTTLASHDIQRVVVTLDQVIRDWLNDDVWTSGHENSEA